MTPVDEPIPPFADLSPDVIIQAIESLGWVCDGRLLALNSYENRVWQVGIEDHEPLIAKFYRPKRWSDEAILEEHSFAQELVDNEIPVIAPLVIGNHTLHTHHHFRFALFPRRGGHAPELCDQKTLEVLGRLMGRLHAVGATRDFQHRPTLDPQSRGHDAVHFLLENDWIPQHLISAFESVTADLLAAIDAVWAHVGEITLIRLHGDCHPGNILWRDDAAHFVDLDDCLMGPAVQDLWMWLSGEHADRSQQLGWLVEAYTDFFPFNTKEIHWIEALRTLRMIHYQAWLAQRWDDPAFPAAFGWFSDDRHWERVVLQLREQLDEMNQPTLTIERP